MLYRIARLLRDLEPNRHFGSLWASQLLSLTAFNMVNFTLLIKVYDLTGSSTMVSLFVLSFGIPSLIFGAVAGVFADRWNRRHVLVVTNLLRVLLVLVYLPAIEHLPTIFVATFLMATVTQFFTPAEGALIPELVERKRLVSANAVFMITMFTSFVLGYGLAGPLAATGGDQLPIMVAAVMFALATLACATLPRHVGAAHKRHLEIGQAYRNVGNQLRDGFRYVLASPAVRYGMAQLTFIWATVGVVLVVLPAYTAQVLHLDLRETSRLVILPIGVGMLAGGYLLHRARKHYRIRTIVLGSLLLAGLSVIALGQVSEVARWLLSRQLAPVGTQPAAEQLVTSTAATLVGLAIAMVMIAAQTLIHERTAPEVRGRIFGVLGTSVNAANTLPVLAAGPLVDVFHVSTVVTAVGIAVVAWGLVSSRFGRGTVDMPA